jgi:hypothetical protein
MTSSSSSAASSILLSPCSEFESLLGAARPRILRWIHQYASFHCMRNTRTEVEAMLQPVIDGALMQRMQEESDYRQQLRECRDILQQPDRPYDSVGIGLEMLTRLCSAAQLPTTVNSSFFQLMQLATVTAALRAADDLFKQEEETGSSALQDYRDVLVDVFSRHLPNSQPAEVRAVQAQGDKSADFCQRYWTLLQRARGAPASSPLVKQLRAIAATYSQSRLDAAVSAVLLEVSRGLQLPLPVLNAAENDLLQRKWKPSKQPAPEPSSASVVDLPPLPIIRLPLPSAASAAAAPPSPASPPTPATPASTKKQKQQKSSKGSEQRPQSGGAGKLEQARRQLKSAASLTERLHAAALLSLYLTAMLLLPLVVAVWILWTLWWTRLLTSWVEERGGRERRRQRRQQRRRATADSNRRRRKRSQRRVRKKRRRKRKKTKNRSRSQRSLLALLLLPPLASRLFLPLAIVSPLLRCSQQRSKRRRTTRSSRRAGGDPRGELVGAGPSPSIRRRTRRTRRRRRRWRKKRLTAKRRRRAASPEAGRASGHRWRRRENRRGNGGD